MSRADRSGVADRVRRDAQVEQLVEAIRRSEKPLSTKGAAEAAGVHPGTTGNLLRQEDEFVVTRVEPIRGASKRYYWGLKVAENEERP